MLPVIANMVDFTCREIVESDDRSAEKQEKVETKDVEEAAMLPGSPVKTEVFMQYEEEPGCSKNYPIPKGRPNGSSPGPLNIAVPGPSFVFPGPDQQCSSKDFLLMEAPPGPSPNINDYSGHFMEHVPGCNGHCDTSYITVEQEVLDHLIKKELVPEYASNVYEHMVKCEPDVDISTEGKQDDDDDELDEASEELRRCQQELKAMEPDLRGIVDFAWNKLVSDFSWWETNAQLDDVDNTLFRLVVNTYREFPRRFPTREEWPALRTAMRRRNEKARLHYGKFYARNPDFYEENAPEVANSEDLKGV